ncbi:trigger factor [Mesomycoplasma lagogenitalium]|uniref:Trigger factor n=1 Tax=Mesomycoplasma lagogenitalium TaxID=171286 RepID=A0ABY8LU80_9BACT|nr:trigger factor [Mesomycoplasma lagogenitalium]WGI36805.1 trigger factor [Mesomycoplasma lagogenitalium]
MTKREILKNTAELKITVSAKLEDWKEQQKKAKQYLMKNVTIPGFRKGKVPADKAEKLVSESKVLERAFSKIINSLEKVAREQIMESDLILNSRTRAEIMNLTSEELSVAFILPIYPDIEIYDYKKIDLDFVEPKVTKEDVKKEIDKLVLSKSVVVDSKEAIKNGDIVTFDFKGFIDGKAFEGGEAENFELKIGSGNFIKGFEEAMIGFNVGDKKEINVSFPADYHSPEYAGKPATFKINVKEIKTYEKPELNNNFVKELSIENVSNIKELEKYLENLLKNEKNEQAKIKFQKDMFDKIIEKTEIPLSPALIEDESKRVKEKFEETLKGQGFTLKEYADLLKFSDEHIENEIQNEAKKNLKTSFIYAEIAKIEKLEATEEDYKNEVEKLAKFYKTTAEAIEQMVPKTHLQIPIINRKVIERLIQYHSGTIGEKIKKATKELSKEKPVKKESKTTTDKKPSKKVVKKSEKSNK